MNKTLLFSMPVLTAVFFSGCIGIVTPNPTTGQARWAVLKCMYSDTVGQTPANADTTIENLFNGEEGVVQWFTEVSYGNYLPSFEIAKSWVTMSVSIAQDRAESFTRGRRIQECISASGIDPSKYAGVIADLNVDIDAGNAGNVLLTPGAWHVSFAAHEMCHSLGLSHSFDTSGRKDATWSAPGEYFDSWDIMSAMNIFGFMNANGLVAGPDMAIPFKLVLGWVTAPKDALIIDARSQTGAAQGLTKDVSLRPYSQATGTNPLGTCLDLGDAAGGFTRYCAEYRTVTGWDRAIPEAGVLIHFLKNGSLSGGNVTVVRDSVFKAQESYTTPDGRATISVVGIDVNSARIRIAY